MKITITFKDKTFVIDPSALQAMEDITREELAGKAHLHPNTVEKTYILIGAGKKITIFPCILEMVDFYVFDANDEDEMRLMYYELDADDIQPKKLILNDMQWVLIFGQDKESGFYLPKWIFNKRSISLFS